MSGSIMIYDGNGADKLCVQAWEREINEIVDTRNYKIEKFNKNYTAGFDRGNIDLIIIPGGDAYKMAPINEIADKINDAVTKKASFLGSCAGALITASYYLHGDKVCDQGNQFNINPVPHCSKYYMPKSNFSDNPENISALEVEWLSSDNFQSNVCKLFYAFGPSFPLKSLPLNSQVIAQFKTDGNVRKASESAAAVLYRPLQTNATPRLLTSVHPEIGITDIRSQEFSTHFDKPDHPHIESLVNQLSDSEIVRKSMCRSWLSNLGLLVRT